ncbi:hypothetical protein H0H81_002817 [Sphagnurus paluster]|uniref:Uncharacterized protein n=1 Tax=Sphagnurus paluster TaxID=117069 RepID=A0A9P7GU45_9AGAR|nr:hypothetical protein H0H81_002817 [Sphagnurus paluster]
MRTENLTVTTRSSNVTNPLAAAACQLSIFSDDHPASLNAYSEVFRKDFLRLMKEYDFEDVEVSKNALGKTFYAIEIRFAGAGSAATDTSKISARLRSLPKFDVTVLRIEQSVAEIAPVQRASLKKTSVSTVVGEDDKTIKKARKRRSKR